MATTQEYIVRKAPITQKVFNVMRFMSGGSVDVKKWKRCGEKVKLEREGGNRGERQSEVDNEPRFGAGSEFGRVERREAREARYRPRKKREEPWCLTVKTSGRVLEEGSSEKEVKKFSGKKDGGVMDNSSFYVFFQAEDGAFEAFPVNEWINFTPVQRFKALTAEQAEEQFEKRDKIMNFFPLMKGVKREENEGNEGILSKQVKKEKTSFKLSELDEWGGVNDSDLDSSEDEGEKGGKKKRGRKKKGSEEERSEAGEDSDEGDFDQRELDYMSESSESESEPEDVRVNKELKSVADEEGLRKIAASDEEDSEEEKNGDDANGKDSDRMDIDGNPIKEKKIKKESGVDGEISESSAEDSDDSDIDESKPWSQIQSKSSVKSGSSEPGSGPTSRAQTPVKEVPESSKSVLESSKSVQGLKRKLTDSTPASPAPSSSSTSNPATPNAQPSIPSSGQPAAKKPKSSDSEGLSEEAVRRYLTRRPMTVRDLIKKFKKSWSGSKQDLMNSIVNILKKINPDKQTIRGELHLSLKAPKQ